MRRIGFYLFIIAVFLLAPLLALPQKAVPAPAAVPTPAPTAVARAAAPYRAVWVSYLEWEQVDFSSAEAFTQAIGTMLDNIQSIGATVVLAQVRPFGDALYPSDYFPFSHLCTGTQGQDPGFDPLALLVDAAHARDLQLEAWVNPYRIQAGQTPALCGASPARLHPDWVRYTDTGAYLDPANADVRQYIADGVGELCARYAVDGIHFDDYFYPTTDPSIDAAQFAASGEADLTAWRRANVTRLVKAAHDAVKAADPTLRFGVSPQGNPDNDRNEQYTDLSVWLTASGADAIVDYLCPQLYWGYGYTLSSGSTRFAFENITAEWLALPRAESTALYFGLGAYRVGVGDGGANADSVSQWCTGSALARQVTDLRSAGAGGWALYRYGSLFRSDESGLAAAERAALTALNG